MVSEDKENSCIQTFTGRYVDPFSIKGEDINIRDIAHSLARQCRFNGHVSKFYSVAEHSVRCTDYYFDQYVNGVATPEQTVTAFGILLHDASEAYFGDIPRPIKRKLPFLKDLENNIQTVVEFSLGLSKAIERTIITPSSCELYKKSIHEADNVLLATEARELGFSVNEWSLEFGPLEDYYIIPYSVDEAECMFLEYYYSFKEFLEKEIW